jgi:hypothetical protein
MNPSAFNPKQLQELQEPLSSQAVRTRNQSGRNLSYIEGWYAISEANRIFGFDSWDQEIVELKCVSERERKIGRDQKPGWGISYVASIRITVNAIKEAATDAMKRALMTFGNQFGLALYDKEQRNVEDKPLNLEQVSESDKTAKKFVDVLLAKMEQAGINSDGIKTLKAILQLTEFEDVKESLRPKLLEKLTPEYAAKLNIGQNAKGDQVIQIVAKEIAQSTADLQKAASEALA